MRASKQRRVPSALIRPALWFCACNLLAAALSAQCTNPTQVPNGTYTSGDHSQVDNNALSATNFVVSGGASATFSAGNCIQLLPGFHASAIGATVPTTFHAWVDIAPTAVSVVPNSPPQNHLSVKPLRGPCRAQADTAIFPTSLPCLTARRLRRQTPVTSITTYPPA